MFYLNYFDTSLIFSVVFRNCFSARCHQTGERYFFFRSNKPVPNNTLVKYADDTFLVVSADSISTRQDELHDIEQWSLANNLKLNCLKSLQVIFMDNRRKHTTCTQLPAELTDIKRVESINILGLGVTVSPIPSP